MFVRRFEAHDFVRANHGTACRIQPERFREELCVMKHGSADDAFEGIMHRNNSFNFLGRYGADFTK